MPEKTQALAQMAEHTATQITGSRTSWTGFLTTVGRLYKYPYYEQLMIYAQRPDATACAEYDLWNNKMNRYVRRGSKGIALIDPTGDTSKLRCKDLVQDKMKIQDGLTDRLTEKHSLCCSICRKKD